MKRPSSHPDLEPLPPEQSDRLNSLFDDVLKLNRRDEPAKAESQEMASDLWELARMRDQYRG
jgi:hypothetical protein